MKTGKHAGSIPRRMEHGRRHTAFQAISAKVLCCFLLGILRSVSRHQGSLPGGSRPKVNKDWFDTEKTEKHKDKIVLCKKVIQEKILLCQGYTAMRKHIADMFFATIFTNEFKELSSRQGEQQREMRKAKIISRTHFQKCNFSHMFQHRHISTSLY